MVNTLEKAMQKYERYDETYTEYVEFHPNGKPVSWGMFGYPDSMLHTAVGRDDAKAFRFYFDHYFNLDCPTVGGSIVLITANRGAEKCVRELIKMGAKDDAGFSDAELIARAKQVAEKKVRDANRVT